MWPRKCSWKLIIKILFTITLLSGSVSADVISTPLLVYSGEPEGVLAAVAAAREGVDTLLVMKRNEPGGLMTYGGLNYLDLNYGPGGENLNKGLFAEWHQRVGGSISFPIEKAANEFQKMIRAEEKKLTVLKNASLLSVKMENGTIKEVVFEIEGKKKAIKADNIIDASQDAQLAYLAGAPFFNGGGDIGLPERHMAVTLVLHLGNINWHSLKKDVESNKFGPSFIDKDHAWGFVKIGKLYKPRDPGIKLRGLNIVSNHNGNNTEVYINSMLIFDVIPTDTNSLQKAYLRGKKEAKYVVSFLRKNLSGFEDAILLDFPEELYVRESRHLVARYQLKVKDLFEQRIFNDTIALASYPLDYQASTPEYQGFVLFNPNIYAVPFRSLIPENIDNLLVVGRSSGYSSLAAASARVLPTGMATGEAAGIAAAVSWKDKRKFIELYKNKDIITYIQQKLDIKNKINYYKYLPPGSIIKNKNILPHLETLLSWGLIVGGYNNNFRLNEHISEKEFAHMIIKGLKRRKAPILYEWVPGGLETMSSNRLLTRNQAAMLLLVAFSKPVKGLTEEECYQQAYKLELVPEEIVDEIRENRLLKRKEAYHILSYFLGKQPLPAELRFYRGED